MMDAFNYLAVLFSVILGLALTQILQGLRGLMLVRSRVRIYWPSLIWMALVFLIVIQDWWAMFTLRVVREWTFPMYAAVLVLVTLLYLVAGLASPDIEADGTVDMRASYFAHSRWFFGLFAAAVVASAVKDLIITGRVVIGENLGFHAVFLATSAIAASTKARWYHALLAPAMAAVFVTYIALLFARL